MRRFDDPTIPRLLLSRIRLSVIVIVLIKNSAKIEETPHLSRCFSAKTEKTPDLPRCLFFFSYICNFAFPSISYLSTNCRICLQVFAELEAIVDRLATDSQRASYSMKRLQSPKSVTNHTNAK